MTPEPQRKAPTAPASDVRETRAASVWADARGIHHVRMKAVGRFTLDDARALHVLRTELSGGRPTPLLVDIGAGTMPTADARAFGRTPEAVALTRALALVSPSRAIRLLGNAALSLFRGTYPTRIFSDEGLALAWLEEHR